MKKLGEKKVLSVNLNTSFKVNFTLKIKETLVVIRLEKLYNPRIPTKKRCSNEKAWFY